MSAVAQAPEATYRPNVGWIAGLLVILAVLGVGAGLWFHFHP